MEPEDIISIDGSSLAEGLNETTVSYEPIDTSRLEDRAIQELYYSLRDYFHNNTITGFRWSAFDGYDLHGVLGAWQYCYAINFVEEFEPARAFELDEANINFFWQPPLIPHENVSQYFMAPLEEGNNAALHIYDTLKASMRRYGERPSALSRLSLDELMIAADSIAEIRYWSSVGGTMKNYAAKGAAIFALTRIKRSLGIVGVIWGAADWVLGLIESAIEDEIVRRLDADQTDELDSEYFRTRARLLGLTYVRLELGAN